MTGLPVGLAMTANAGLHAKNLGDGAKDLGSVVVDVEKDKEKEKKTESKAKPIVTSLVELAEARLAGKLTEREFTIAKRRILFEQLDLDGDGVLTADELAQATPAARKEMLAIHNALDLNGDGQISLEELEKANKLLDAKAMKAQAAGKSRWRVIYRDGVGYRKSKDPLSRVGIDAAFNDIVNVVEVSTTGWIKCDNNMWLPTELADGTVLVENCWVASHGGPNVAAAKT